jgi:hypothetical protein
MRATSRKRVICPSACALRTTAPNSSGVSSRPLVTTASWNRLSGGCGDWPNSPAATSTFCRRMAATMSLAVRLRAEAWLGSIQIRMQ